MGRSFGASDTTDEEEAWVNPMFWDFQLARHKAWFTIHAVENDQRLLCGRVLDQGFERVVNPPDALPVCRVCRARVRGRVEVARRQGREAEPASPPEQDEPSFEFDSGEATPSCSSE